MPANPTALITGIGDKRLGWHVAEALARQGYHIAVHYRHSEGPARDAVARFRALGVRAEAFHAELADEQQVEALVAGVRDTFGRLDLLVNAAGLWRRAPLEAVTARDVQEHFASNVLATFLCARAAGLVMAGQPEGGCIVNLGDWAEARPYPGYAAYFASKGAIPALTRCLAIELAARNPNVRVNCIQPGPVLMPEDLPQEERDRAIASTLARRPGRPEDVARAVLFLAQSDFITGTCLVIDGGRTIYPSDDPAPA
jgi:pteridine reductase